MDKSNSSTPAKYEESFLLKRIDENDIEISLRTRNEVIKALATNTRYIQIGKYTIMVNSIKSIDPVYGMKNIPPRPKELLEATFDKEKNTASTTVINQDEIDKWDAQFSKKNLLSEIT